jgi:uncharacterized protein YciI
MEATLKRIRPLLVGLLLWLVGATPAPAQEAPKYDMGKVQLVFLSLSPESKATDTSRQVMSEHRAAVEKLIKEGGLAISGEVSGDGPLREIMVIKTESPEEARQAALSLPAVKAGLLKPEVLSWFAARNFITPPQMPLTTANYVFGLLVRGPKWTAEVTEETKKLQEGHMANINRLAEAGKLVLAGPFFDGGERRGVFIFKVDTLEEAQALTESDPAVKAGRLKIELHRWAVPKGTLK